MTVHAASGSPVPSKTLYQLLEIPSSAGLGEVKRAFRVQIARYHPDKVQHLGKEFQEMAAERAAALNEAYQILSNEQRRAEYDRALSSNGERATSPDGASSIPSDVEHQPAPATRSPDYKPVADAASNGHEPFSGEREVRDHVVRRATVSRLRQAVDALGAYDEAESRGFDFTWRPKSRFFGRGKGPRLVCRLVSRVDRDSVAGAWSDAGKSAADDDVCVFLLGADLASGSELARAIAEQRRRTGASRITLIPVDARTWDAHLPTDAPPVAKTVLARLKTGT